MLHCFSRTRDAQPAVWGASVSSFRDSVGGGRRLAGRREASVSGAPKSERIPSAVGDRSPYSRFFIFYKAEQFSLTLLAAWFRMERMKAPPIYRLSASVCFSPDPAKRRCGCILNRAPHPKSRDRKNASKPRSGENSSAFVRMISDGDPKKCQNEPKRRTMFQIGFSRARSHARSNDQSGLLYRALTGSACGGENPAPVQHPCH